ncbi:uncharacterized protein HMPREF1541_08144 [Cyphellophora europaea CBS 101466]|uniref:Alpha/beta hydrolase fold-3 domain-containing protein n=1 Tax=Cyphellophora europaea (strain CBS 101466) TaxID=1220924 RepID=W2RN33_CYPE1|nr:uncharacterized protein HMPREF1541_08144 [Cyphellophora europaea CBS 101466]ETN37154.1 hypothetical protein HMPREF1541_08144 [Cyphellophora europaea CBS 101466]
MDVHASGIVTTERDDLSLTYRVLTKLMRPFRPKLAGIPTKPYPSSSPKLEPPKLGYDVKEHQRCGVYIYDIITQHGKQTPKRRLFYFAGGGFQGIPSDNHWKFCAELARQLSPSYQVSVVSYPLAPPCPAPKSLPTLREMLHALISEAHEAHQDVCLMGDSSGGNIALSLGFWWASQMASESNLPPLHAIFAMSPAVDMTNANPEISEIDKVDPLLTAKMTEDVAKTWVAEWERNNPHVSPLYGDFKVLKASGVKVHGLIGTYDVLAPDALKFRAVLAEAGIPGEWLIWKKQMHCFPLAFKFPIRESRQGKDWVVDVLRRDVKVEKSS